MKIAEQIKSALRQAIDDVAAQKERYVMNPEKDFTRDRKMPMRDVINMIISMEGGSLGKELSHFSSQKKMSLTASAFVQQRSKIKSSPALSSSSWWRIYSSIFFAFFPAVST